MTSAPPRGNAAESTAAVARRRLIATAVALCAALPAAAGACGVCVEDKVAATYDHAVVRAAIENRQQVVFVALDGVEATRLGARIAAAASSVRGVQPGSVRTAVAPAAFSFVLRAGESPEDAMKGFRTAVAGSDVRMTVVRVMRDRALIDPR